MSSSLFPKKTSSVLSSTSSICKGSVGRASQQCRSFSATTRDEARTLQRRNMFKWLNGPGSKIREALPGSSCNYLGAYNKFGELKRLASATKSDPEAANRPPPPIRNQTDYMPFPQNEHFKAEPITSQAQRQEVWKMIVVDGLSVKETSARLGIEMSRVGAIVRLQEIERAWMNQGKKLAKPYARAINEVIPQGDLTQQFESVNDLPVHKATQQQIFWPAAESRQFTREDAAKVFADGLLPADKRVPHPEMIQRQKEFDAGIAPQERAALEAARSKAENEKKAAALQRRLKKEAAAIKTVEGARWDFKFREIKVDDAGATGRDLKGTGWRYGAPLRDRIRGEIKIPTRV